MKKSFFLLPFLIIFAVSLNAQVLFKTPVFGEGENLLFSAELECPGFGRYSTLFDVNLDDRDFSQLTIFPEEAVMLDGGNTLQIRNRYGLFRTKSDFSGFEVIKSYPGFIEGKQIKEGKMFPSHPSPDGRYLAYLQPVSHGYASLILYDVAQGTETVISDNLDLTYSDEVVLWAPDSEFFVYSKGGEVFYYSLEQYYAGKTLAEEFRKIGKGLISNVRWSAGKELFYLSDSVIYKIIPAQLFTTSLYRELMEIGEISGKIPFDFDPAFDSFYVSPDGEKIIFNKAGSNIFLYFLKNSNYISTGDVVSLPYLYLPRNTRLKKVVWPTSDIVTILTTRIEGGSQKTSVFRFDLRYTDKPLEFKQIPEENVTDLELSMNSETVAVLYNDRIAFKDYKTWSTSGTLKFDSPIKSFWISDSELLITGKYSTEKYDIYTDSSTVLTVSQADSSGYTKSGSVYASSNGNLFILDKETGWKRVFSLDEEVPVSVSDKYRVYTQDQTAGPYQNMIMMRKLDSFGTEALFPYPESEYEAFPARDDDINFDNFSHGSRIRRREISIVFNAIDSAEGLTEVLNVLDHYDISATFFVNGNFMRRNPEAVQELANSSHEIGSLFYSYFNMTDARYRLDKEFIKRGLARNEDDYYALTGEELALLWHAPYYVVSSDIIDASKEMNYTYINRDIDPLEWVWDVRGLSSQGLSVAEMIETIMNKKKPGSIIPIRLGESTDGTEPLFASLELLLNDLIEQGYSVVPVSVLIDRARR